MGAVFSGYREADRQPVAIKVLVPRTASDWTAWELFERSTQVLMGLRYPELPAVHAFERAEPARLILVREAFDGGTLEERIRTRDARLSVEQAVGLLGSLLELLACLESRVPPVVHRDIKPANIMFRSAADWSTVPTPPTRPSLTTWETCQQGNGKERAETGGLQFGAWGPGGLRPTGRRQSAEPPRDD